MKLARPLIILVVLASLIVGGIALDRSRAKARAALSGIFESRPIVVSSRTGGRVSHLSVEEGDRPVKGSVLLTLESTPDLLAAQALESQARQAQQKAAEASQGRGEEEAIQKAALAEAQADLQKLLAGPRPQEIAAARAAYLQAESRLAEADHGSLPEEEARARAALAEAEARLARVVRGSPDDQKRLGAQIESARSQEALAMKELRRSEKLYADGAISGQALDKARSDAQVAQRQRESEEAALAAILPRQEDIDAARQQVVQARQSLILVRKGPRAEQKAALRAARDQAKASLDLLLAGSRSEDISAAKARVASLQARLASIVSGSERQVVAQARSAQAAAAATARASRARVDESRLAAPRSGQVERVLVSEGDLVAAGQALVRMSDPSDLYLRVFVPESRLSLVSVGDRCLIEADGMSQPLEATVESVASQGEYTPANLQAPVERGQQVYAVRVTLASPNPRVKAGMAATVRRIGGWTP